MNTIHRINLKAFDHDLFTNTVFIELAVFISEPCQAMEHFDTGNIWGEIDSTCNSYQH